MEQPTDYYEIPSVPQTRRPLGLDMDDTLGDRFFDLNPTGSSPTPARNRQLPPNMPESVPMINEEKENEPTGAAVLPQRRSRKDLVPQSTVNNASTREAHLPQRRSAANATSQVSTNNSSTREARLPQRRSAANATPQVPSNNASSTREARLPQRRSATNATSQTPTNNVPTREARLPIRRSADNGNSQGQTFLPIRSASNTSIRRSGAMPSPVSTSQRRSALSNGNTRAQAILPRRSASASRLPTTNTQPDKNAQAPNGVVNQRQARALPKPVVRSNLANLPRAAAIAKNPRPVNQLRSASVTARNPTPAQPSSVRRSALETKDSHVKPGDGKPNTVFPTVLRSYRTPTGHTPMRPATLPNTPRFQKTIVHKCLNVQNQAQGDTNVAVATTSSRVSSTSDATGARRSEAFWERLSKPKHVTAKTTTTPQVFPKPPVLKVSRVGVAGVPTPKVVRAMPRHRNQEPKKE